MFAEDKKEVPVEDIEQARQDLIDRVTGAIEKHNWVPLKFVKAEDTPPPPEKKEGWDG